MRDNIFNGSVHSKRRLPQALQATEGQTEELRGHVIIAGFGRVGQIIGQLLAERLIPFVAVDVRMECVQVRSQLPQNSLPSRFMKGCVGPSLPYPPDSTSIKVEKGLHTSFARSRMINLLAPLDCMSQFCMRKGSCSSLWFRRALWHDGVQVIAEGATQFQGLHGADFPKDDVCAGREGAGSAGVLWGCWQQRSSAQPGSAPCSMRRHHP